VDLPLSQERLGHRLARPDAKPFSSMKRLTMIDAARSR